MEATISGSTHQFARRCLDVRILPLRRASVVLCTNGHRNVAERLRGRWERGGEPGDLEIVEAASSWLHRANFDDGSGCRGEQEGSDEGAKEHREKDGSGGETVRSREGRGVAPGVSKRNLPRLILPS